MIKLIEANSFSYDYQNNIKKVDYIISSPPFFHSDPVYHRGEEYNLGKDGLIHFKNTIGFMKILSIILKSKKTLIQISTCSFCRISNKKIESVDYAIKELKRDTPEGWSHISEQDAHFVLTREFPDLKGKTVLDCFCGSGQWITVANSFGAECIGIDINKNQLELASKKLGIKND